MTRKDYTDKWDDAFDRGYRASRIAFENDLAERGLGVEIRDDDVLISGVGSAECEMTVGDNKCTFIETGLVWLVSDVRRVKQKR